MPFFLVHFTTWLGNAVFSIIYFYGARKAILLAGFIVIIGLIGVATNALISNIDSLMGQAMPSGLEIAAPFIPDNFGLCLSLIVTAHLACTTYRLALKLIAYKASFMLA